MKVPNKCLINCLKNFKSIAIIISYKITKKKSKVVSRLKMADRKQLKIETTYILAAQCRAQLSIRVQSFLQKCNYPGISYMDFCTISFVSAP